MHFFSEQDKLLKTLTIECPGGCPTGRILPVGQLDRAQRWRLKCSNLGPGPYVMLIKWYRVIKSRRCIAKPKKSMIVCARTVSEEGMELSAVVIMCLNSAPKSAQVLPCCCLVLHLQCVLFLDVLLVAQPSGRRSTENKTWAARLAIVTCFSLRRLANDAFPLSVGLAGQAEERSQLVISVVVIILFVDIRITASPAPPRVWPSSGAR